MTKENTVRFKKDFNDLTDSGKKARLRKYEEERAERGTQQDLARLVRDVAPSIKEIKDGAKSAYLRLAVWNAETQETDFFTVSAYIAPDKVGTAYEDFYAGLQKGDLVSVEYKKNGEFNNAYSVFLRQKAKKKSA